MANSQNYIKAKEEADKIEASIIKTLKEGKNFRVEAGAGSGKTYSLNRVIEWIQENRSHEYRKKKQIVICITYTNAAVEVINNRLQDKSFIVPSTIHSFAWNAIKQYQTFLVSTVKEDEQFWAKDGNMQDIVEIQYDLGHRYIKDHVLYLFHDDVIKLFALLLDNKKFRSVFSNKYPLILIDEYQDSFEIIINRFITYFINENIGPQFGFFGDSWQTIYQSQKTCGLIEHDNINEIKKGSNFRSAPKIVEALNIIRPDLPQLSAVDDFDGEVVVVTCNDYSGARRNDRNFNGELPVDILQQRLDLLTSNIRSYTNEESLKILMITHKVLASQQGYEQILSILGDKFKDKDDDFLMFAMDKIEPILQALKSNDTALLFDKLGVKRYPVNRKEQKKQWQNFKTNLIAARNNSAIDVLKCVIESNLIPIPKQIDDLVSLYNDNPNSAYGNATIKDYLEIHYSQFLSAINFLYPETEFSTDHGVKGEEYDNVIFAITKGWNQYQFELFAPMILNGYPKDKESAFIRNRNLFYVCCSRPKKRLIIFVSLEVDSVFETFLKKLSGVKNYYTFPEYIKKLQLPKM